MNLSLKQQVFVAEYLRCWNATEAARRAAYAHPNKQGPRLLVNVGIDVEIKRRLRDLCMGSNETLVRLGEQARAAYADYLLPEGAVDLERLLVDGKGHLVKGIKRTKYGDEIEFYDAQTALIQIGKHHKLFHEGEISGPEGHPIEVNVKGDLISRINRLVAAQSADGIPGEPE